MWNVCRDQKKPRRYRKSGGKIIHQYHASTYTTVSTLVAHVRGICLRSTLRSQPNTVLHTLCMLKVHELVSHTSTTVYIHAITQGLTHPITDRNVDLVLSYAHLKNGAQNAFDLLFYCNVFKLLQV